MQQRRCVHTWRCRHVRAFNVRVCAAGGARVRVMSQRGQVFFARVLLDRGQWPRRVRGGDDDDPRISIRSARLCVHVTDRNSNAHNCNYDPLSFDLWIKKLLLILLLLALRYCKERERIFRFFSHIKGSFLFLSLQIDRWRISSGQILFELVNLLTSFWDVNK